MGDAAMNGNGAGPGSTDPNLNYREFLQNKTHSGQDCGFDPVWLPDFLFGFQRSLVEWAVRKGRSAIFADCGLGKTPIQLVWAENVVRKTNGRVLIVTPLAVSAQTIREGEKFGVSVTRSTNGKPAGDITVTNYERLHLFDSGDYVGMVCDESSAIKAFNGKRRKEVTRFISKMGFRLLCTATAAPNDYIELGTHSEALGVLGQMDMLSMFFKSTDDMNHVFFKNGDFWNTHKWMFKAHAEQVFWRWVVTWARAIRKPSDLGFPDDGFELPPMNIRQTVVPNSGVFTGELFPRIAVTLNEQREERRMTMEARCAKVASLLDHKDPAVAWCHLNEEGDRLESEIPGAYQIKGATPDDQKEELFRAFADGEIRVLVTKPKIGAFGLNWQHCNHMTFFPSHSFEQFYQGTRRCWRFGQKRAVNVDIVTTEGEAGVTANLNAKAEAAHRMFESLVSEMNSAMNLKPIQEHTSQLEVPSWA